MTKTGARIFLVTLIAGLTLALASCAHPATSPIDVGGAEFHSPADAESVAVTVTSTTTPSVGASLMPEPEPEPKVIEGFVEVTDIDDTIVIDLRYATTNNFTGQKVYPTDTCVLRLKTAQKLAEANAEVARLGYRIKVWDAYRPVSVQKIFWSICPDSRYVANPSKGGSIHNRGCAVDVTLVDSKGEELVMPSAFDDFSAQASPSNQNMSAEARANLDVLRDAMLGNGFTASTTEWWHYSDSDRDKYSIVEVDLSLF